MPPGSPLANTIRAAMSFIRDADWLTAARAQAYCIILAALLCLSVLVLIASSRNGVDAYGRPIGTDFVSFWTASRIALSGAAASVYDVSRHWAAQRTLFDAAAPGYTAFFYPPPFLLVCLPLALLPYFASLACWLAATGFAYVRALRRVAGRAGLALPILAFPGVYSNAMHGQNGFLTTALFAGGMSLLKRRPALAGALLGCLSIKPHLCLMIPLALAAARRWTSLLAAAASAAALAAATYLVFGLATWHAFLAGTALARQSLEHDLIGYGKMQSVFAAVRLLGGGVAAAYAAQAGAAAVAAALLIHVCRRAPTDDTIGGAAILAGLLTTPFLLAYDLLLLAVPLALMVRQAQATGFRPWEKSVLLAAFMLPLISPPLAVHLHVPAAPFVLIALYALFLRRALAAEGAGGPPAAPAAA